MKYKLSISTLMIVSLFLFTRCEDEPSDCVTCTKYDMPDVPVCKDNATISYDAIIESYEITGYTCQ